MKYIYALLSLCVLASFVGNENSFAILMPKEFPEPVYNITTSQITQAKIDLGRALFYDPILSKNNTISCSSCHLQYTAFTHVDHAVSHGIDDKTGTRNAPTLMNLAWHKNFMWDGAINHLDMQSLAPISNPLEMGETIENVVNKLQNSSIYPKHFFMAFGDSIISGEHTLKALSAFMLTFISNNSKYDSVMRNQTTFTLQQQNGYRLFKQHCNVCHTEPLFTSFMFENNGLAFDTVYNDIGRMRISGLSTDSLKFKIPTLRNIEFSYPYMHDGRFNKLSDVLNHYDKGIVHYTTTSEILQQPIRLSSDEKVDIIAFMLCLTDKSFLFNPAFSYPKNFYK